MAKFKIKKGDMVKIIAGDDKGKSGKILHVFPKKSEVIVEGCKIAKKAIKPTEENKKGGFVNKEMPYTYFKCQKRGRVGDVCAKEKIQRRDKIAAKKRA